jgi:hypothetical protein
MSEFLTPLLYLAPYIALLGLLVAVPASVMPGKDD